MTLELINKQDNFEVVRDQISAYLTLQTASQQQQAQAAGFDPDLWKFRVFSEAFNPWEEWLNVSPDTPVDESPIVNVWFDNSNFPANKGDTVERQASVSLYNIDCYAYAAAQETPEGHLPGDQAAALVLHRTIRLVRNMLMSAENTYLGLRGLVWGRRINGINAYQPQIDNRQVQQVIAARFTFEVTFNEFSPQVAPQELCYLSASINRAETGELFAQADYDYTQGG